MAKLTPKQFRFADEYLIDLNATQAAIRAGYSPKTANEQGARLLANVSIQEYIAEMMALKDKALIAAQDEVLEYLTAVMRREYKENIVVTLTEEKSTYKPDNNGTMRKQTIKREIPSIVEIPAKLSDANKAAELLGKRYNLFTDKLKIEGQIPTVIVDDLRDSPIDVIGFAIDSEGEVNE